MFKYFYNVYYTIFLIFNYRLVHIHAQLYIFHFNNIMIYVYVLNIYHKNCLLTYQYKILQYTAMISDG